MSKPNEFLLKRSYRYYAKSFDHPYAWSALYQQQLTELETKAVCETNGKLFIHVEEYRFKGDSLKYTVQIIAERNDLWWTLNAYSLSETELYTRIEEIENTLIKLFNAI